MAESISELVTSKKELVNSLKLVTSLDKKLTNLEIRVRVLELGRDLLSLEYPNDMTAWYCKCYKELGEVKFGIICSMARQGRKPKQLFGWLLKQEIMK
jgi:hypothetical protein